MFNEYKKSARSVFEERISSPFYGAFLFSWLVLNWKIVYLTIFVNQDIIEPLTKIEYIQENYINIYTLIILPLLSSGLLIVVVPFISNKLFQVHLYYENDRRKRKEKYDSQQRLTIEQTSSIRTEMVEQSAKYERILDRNKTEQLVDKEQINKLSERIKHLEFTIGDEDARRKRFSILQALYGKPNASADVTETIRQFLENGERFEISNKNMGSDPFPGKQKDLWIVYQKDGQVKSFFSQEYYTLQLVNEEFVPGDTPDSIRIREIEEGMKIMEYFQGNWELKFSGKENGQEEFIVDSPNIYCVKQADSTYKRVFRLQNIEMNVQDASLSFTKKGMGKDKRETRVTLKVLEKGISYVGTEQDGTVAVNYKRIIPPAILTKL